MIDPQLPSLVSILAFPRRTVTGFTAENVAARPEIVERGPALPQPGLPAVWVVLSVTSPSSRSPAPPVAAVRRLKERAGL